MNPADTVFVCRGLWLARSEQEKAADYSYGRAAGEPSSEPIPCAIVLTLDRSTVACVYGLLYDSP